MNALHARVAAAVDGRTERATLITRLARGNDCSTEQVDRALGELVALGWLNLRDTPRWTSGKWALVVPPLLGLLVERYELHEVPLRGSPCHYCVAAPRADADHLLPEAARHGQGRGGAACGFSRADAIIRALGEAAETVSACWHGDEPVEIASWDEVREHAICPNDLMGYSQAQYATRDAWNAIHGEYEWIPPPLAEHTPIAWTRAQDRRTGESILVPAACVWLGFRDQGLEEPFYVADSNGCAVGATEADAIERGLLELVERDATGWWWYGERRCPPVPIEQVEAAGVAAVLAWHRRSGRTLHLIDISSDPGAPVCAAVSANARGRCVLLGFAAAPEMPQAVASALAELLQAEAGAATLLASAGAELPANLRFWFDTVDLSRCPQLVPRPGDAVASIHGQSHHAPATHDEAHRTLAIRYPGGSPRAALPSARVFCPGHGSHHLRLGVRRMTRPTDPTWNDNPTGITRIIPLCV